VLRDLGYRTSVRAFSDFGRYLEFVGDANNQAQIGHGGWISAILAPSDFFQPFSCSDSLNPSRFCDPKLDARARRAAALQASNPVQANRLWSEIERQLVLQAPIVPVANVRQRVFVSRRVGNHQSHPLWGTLIDQLWVE
jgi:peptide/nickel transport system substrate-binding protein